MSFPFDSYQRVSALLRALNEPLAEVRPPAPVFIVSDFTRSASTEAFESRGLASGVLLALAGSTARFQLHAPSRPCVVESLRIKVGNASASLSVLVGPYQDVSPPVGAVAKLECGGIPTTALVDSRRAAGALAGTVQIPLELGPQEIPTNGSLRVLVPIGQTLVVACSLVNVQLEYLMLWREVPV